MDSAFFWWLASTALGLVALPYCAAAFPNLPDRGWCFARPAGLLLTAYVLWLAGSAGLLPNNRGAVLLSLLLVALGALVLLRGTRTALAATVRRNARALLAYEVVYLVAFAGMAVLRAYNPELSSTEKPMDLAMLNTAMRSPELPPLDPWLAGFAVNYYYFGYVMMAAVGQLAATPAPVGFNLGLALLYASSAVAATGLVANMVSLLRPSAGGLPRVSGPGVRAGVLGAALLLLAGNLLGLLEVLRAHGIAPEGLWRWLSIKHGDDGTGRLVLLGVPPDQPYVSSAWYPTENWWWWRATRLVDTVVAGRSADYTITEFPFFSFLLGDLHPHVMSLPFGLLALGVCLAAFLQPAAPLGVWLRQRAAQACAAVLVVGGIGFVNGWDLVPYLALLFTALGARAWLDHGPAGVRAWTGLAVLAAATVAAVLVAFGLFYLPLAFQVVQARAAEGAAGGLPLAVWQGPSTRPAHFALFWWALLVPSAALLFGAAARVLPRSARRPWWALLTLAVAAIAAAELWWALNPGAAPDENPLRTVGRFWLVAPLGLALAVALHRPTGEGAAGTRPALLVRFGAGLLAAALVLLLASELVHVRDVFGNRMNTVFKLWYQAWTWLAIAGAFGLALARLQPRTLGAWVWTGLAAGAFALACVYTIAAPPAKTDGFRGPPTLDGLAYLRRTEPGEAEALAWLAAQPAAGEVVLEATGSQYSFAGRAATVSGIPTVLGWAGHEVQWRGSDALFRERPADIDAMFNAADKRHVQGLLDKYRVTYVYVGSLEKAKYPKSALDAFAASFPVAYQNETVTIYRVRQPE